jgi:hypothetical protein
MAQSGKLEALSSIPSTTKERIKETITLFKGNIAVKAFQRSPIPREPLKGL